jgi:hypothetical protein
LIDKYRVSTNRKCYVRSIVYNNIMVIIDHQQVKLPGNSALVMLNDNNATETPNTSQPPFNGNHKILDFLANKIDAA